MPTILPVVKSSKSVPNFKNTFLNILKMNKSTNKFVITNEQLDEFQKFITDNTNFKNFSNWFKFFSQKGVKNLPILFSPFQRNHQNIYDDQNKRSSYIVDYMKKNPDSELVTMDGHGRLIYSIISLFEKEKSFIDSKKKIHLVDIDKTTNEFHKKIFPSDVFNNTINIPEEQDILKLDTSFFEREKISNPFLYLNFCGISCCGTKDKSGKEIVFDFVKKWLENHNNIMISLSLRPYGFKTHYKGKVTTYGMLQNFNNLELISKRSNFVTYIINK